MALLGATLEELITLSQRLTATSSEIGQVSADTQGVATRVVEEMQASFAIAVTGISGAMDVLRTSVDSSRGQLESTTWTGANRAIFDGAYGDFTAAMHHLELAIGDTYAEFDAQMHQISSMIEAFQAQVMMSLDQAQGSTTSMAHAVDAQRDNLDLAMNQGIAVG